MTMTYPDSVCRDLREPGVLRAFTLVEVLFAISIIAVLLSILVPALRTARESAQNVACLSNHRQFGVAWNSYLLERRTFPGERVSNPGQNLTKYWGGVDVQRALETLQGEDGGVQAGHGHVDRLLNEYLGAEASLTNMFDIFMCPSDMGVTYSGDGFDPSLAAEQDWLDEATSFQHLRGTSFAQFGNSYRANDFIWVPIGSQNGWRSGYERRQRPEDVFRPSNWILTIDTGASEAVRAADDYRYSAYGWGVQYGWWHGAEKGNAAFLDGSARTISSHTGSAANSEWAFWVDERAHDPERDFLSGWAPLR